MTFDVVSINENGKDCVIKKIELRRVGYVRIFVKYCEKIVAFLLEDFYFKFPVVPTLIELDLIDLNNVSVSKEKYRAL